MTVPSDEALMLAYQNGDFAAFELLYRNHSARIWAYIQKRLNNPEVATEVYQAVFLKIHQSRGTYDPKFPVIQWFFVVARTVLMDHYRHQGRQIDVVDSPSDIENAEDLSQTAVASSLMEEKDLSALDHLSDEQKKVVEWRVVDETSFSEIGKRLGKSEASVRQILSRSLKRLRGKQK